MVIETTTKDSAVAADTRVTEAESNGESSSKLVAERIKIKGTRKNCFVAGDSVLMETDRAQIGNLNSEDGKTSTCIDSVAGESRPMEEQRNKPFSDGETSIKGDCTPMEVERSGVENSSKSKAEAKDMKPQNKPAKRRITPVAIDPST